MANLLIYFNNYSSLGHSTIVFSLIQSLKRYFKEKIQIFVVENGASETKHFAFGKFSQYFFLQDEYNYSSIPDKGFEKKRYAALKDIADHCKPDILITEYFPFCKNRNGIELFLLLSYLKRKYRTKIVSSCTYINWSDQTYEIIENFYDSIIFHLPFEFSKGYLEYLPPEGTAIIDRIIANHSQKIVFSGFVIQKDNRCMQLRERSKSKHKLCPPAKKLVVVSTGGLKNYPKIISSAISTAKCLPDYFFAVFNDDFYNGLAHKINYPGMWKKCKNLKLFKLDCRLFENYLKACDLSINMAGYNTMVKLLFYKKRSIIIPLNNTEQIWHAGILSQLLHSPVLDYKNINQSALVEQIRAFLKSGDDFSPKIDQGWFEGLENTMLEIKNFV